MKRKAWMIAGYAGSIVILCALIAAASLLNTGSFRYMHQTDQGIAWGNQSLSAEATASVTTGLVLVKSCVATVNTEAATTPAHVAICTIPTQTGSNRGKVTLTVNNVGSTASGTTVINYIAVGQGGR